MFIVVIRSLGHLCDHTDPILPVILTTWFSQWICFPVCENNVLQCDLFFKLSLAVILRG